MSVAAVKLDTGHVLDERYHLDKVIGRGGMGTVFAARHLELNEMVAVKVLQSENAVSTLDAENLERFLREARLCSKIKNEHVVRIIDVARGKNGSPPYIVMELLDGVDLGELVRGFQNGIPYRDAVDYVLQACEALAEAHALGIVHRDLKSSNLHRTRHPDGTITIKVLDFGISKAHDEGDTNLTHTSAVFGSPAYMSPEQIRSAKHVDHRTDIWALAVVLFELMTNELPFLGDSPASMLAAISADPPLPARKFVPDVPFELDKAINAALQKNRDRRTPSVAALAASIAPFGGPTAPQLLANVQRAAARASSRSASVQAPPAPVGAFDTGPVSDTMRVSDTSLAGQAPPPVMEPAVSRTDREMVIPTRGGGSTSTAAILGVVGLILGIALGGAAVLFVVMRSRTPRPPPPPVVVVTAPPPAADPTVPPPPQSAMVAAPPVAAPAVSAGSAVRRPHPAPHPVATPVPSPKPNGSIDLDSRH